MFVAIATLLVLAWLLGFGLFHVAGGLIHVLLLFALISLAWHFFNRRGTPG